MLLTTTWAIKNVQAKTNHNNKSLGKWKKRFRPTLRWMICMTLDCVGITHTDQSLQCWSEVFFFNVTKMFVCYYHYAYFIDISQSSVETHLWCGGIYNNHIIANCLQSVPVKEFWKSVNTGEDMNKSKVAHFFGPPCMLHSARTAECHTTECVPFQDAAKLFRALRA